ncbi:sigma-70 family RNA polymerase sigma factor [Gimesia algae]|uniref:RNA polymerase sigma factor SigA n=1 Tax=Gimesia algae TaxID=2527971 RepID=A0A517VAR5_9PLAN|nr:sigma-70 family RNA polymerase sigma factor [Gimesia algae]QDT90079.1 RNA polymerase sigma factor SigA [Gimesia algae]
MIVCSKEFDVCDPDSLSRRARKILDQEIDFISNPSFNDDTAESDILRDVDTSSNETWLNHTDTVSSSGSSTTISRLCRADVLSAEEERNLFRRLNYLKYKANQFRSQLNPEWVTENQLNRIEELLHRAQLVRDEILRRNMRLVVSIVKKCMTTGISFDELFSDGCLTLLKAIDKFDYSRGFRFSTYAYHAISNYAYRKIANLRKERAQYKQLPPERSIEETGEVKNPLMGTGTWDELSELLNESISTLDEREQLIVKSRFALGKHRKTLTFQKLADQLGISKERVRQLEQRAVAKLRAVAEGTRLDLIRDLL